MIKVTVRKAAEAAGVEKAYQLQTLLDCSPSLARNLWLGKQLPELKTLDRVCDALDCELGDLIIWTPNTKRGILKASNGTRKNRFTAQELRKQTSQRNKKL